MLKPPVNSIFNHRSLHLLQRCKTLRSLNQAHAQIITTGLILHTYPISRLLLISSSIASITYTLTIFYQFHSPSIFLFNTLISSFATNHHLQLAFSLYTQVISTHLHNPNQYTYPSLFKACGSLFCLSHGRSLHAHVFKFLDPPYDRFIQTSLVDFYSRCGRVDNARKVFDRITQPDLVTWNSMLSAYTRKYSSIDSDANCSLEVLVLFKEMQISHVMPNELTLVALITACANLGLLSQGIWAHGYVLKQKLDLNRFVGTSLIDMYVSCGCLYLARQLFDRLPERDTFCYNTMIKGLAIHGYGHQALDLFEEMELDEELSPDEATIVVIITACSHSGLTDKGCEIFDSMMEIHGIEPRLEHYCCLVDLLGRAGRFKEAEERIMRMPMKPNEIIWRSLLAAARIHSNLESGEIALRNLIELDPETSGNYVLLSNLYARIGKWDDVNRLRKLMKDRKIEKMPGVSMVEINGVMHEFLTGDRRHSMSVDIYLKLEEIFSKVKLYGHKAETKEVLFEIEEEEKEDALSYHSERLAIAFALIVSDEAGDYSTPIRIIKNLRVCSDCHAITKVISRIYDREIIVRDRTRFHHFKEGNCSCSDFW
ncbi:pentatricopeptide repeat-containing protein At5g43790 [Impatiens glandulifera]|uniref:pentatricopeptide repeat-containing protein At5g43790 n=1 Tax=Impatiens glandulifera TaxID=253017 RepID=UPI001FB198B2|nr:pentatricopeptide repeat-containing protein At5g43790 [Impatiens glandulifera]